MSGQKTGATRWEMLDLEETPEQKRKREQYNREREAEPGYQRGKTYFEGRKLAHEAEERRAAEKSEQRPSEEWTKLNGLNHEGKLAPAPDEPHSSKYFQ